MLFERSSPARAVRLRAQARDLLLCSWARHWTLTVPLSTHAYKWLQGNSIPVVTLRLTSIPSRLIASCYRNRDNLLPKRLTSVTWVARVYDKRRFLELFLSVVKPKPNQSITQPISNHSKTKIEVVAWLFGHLMENGSMLTRPRNSFISINRYLSSYRDYLPRYA